MKKIIKLSKIFLLIVTVFSYVASPISVLAEEVINNGLKPIVFDLKASEDGSEYTLSYISANPNDYEDAKEYKIKLDTNITYTNGDKETDLKEFSVLGSVLNSLEGGNEDITAIIDEDYTAEYIINVSVYDELNEVLYSDELKYETNYLVGINGRLNDNIIPENEVVGETTVGNYNVTEGVYTQKMSILPGGLSPMAEYRILKDSVEGEVEYSDIMSAENLVLEVVDGTQTDLTGMLAGTYSYTDSITFEEVDTTGTELVVENVYTYNYNANLVYGSNNDDLFSNMYQDKAVFMDGYMVLPAKGFASLDTVITIRELLDRLSNTDITLEVIDGSGNKLYPVDSNYDVQIISGEETLNDILDTEVKNDYVVKFTNGATATYTVVVVGDANSDNEFTTEDLVGVIQGYIAEENMPSMDLISSNTATSSEKIGTVTFEDVIVTNEMLKEQPELNRTEEDNEKLGLTFGEISDDVYVGDVIELDVVLNEKLVEEIIDNNNGDESNNQEVIEFIEGIDGNIKLSDNLKIREVRFNDEFTGSYNETGRVVAVGNAINKDAVVMSIVLEVVSLGEGKANVEFSGYTSKYLNIDEFEAITTEFDVIRRISTNNNLASLSANVGSFDISFDSEVNVYTLTVPYNTESVVLSGTLDDEYAVVEGFGEYNLTEDKTTINITVTAEDGSVNVYTVYVIKEAASKPRPIVNYYSSNNYLETLVVDGYQIEFNKYTGEYRINVKNDVTSLDITALAEHSKARVQITGNGDFKEGNNTVIITVTAQNGSTREYKLIVTKDEKKELVDNSSNTAEKVVIIVLIVLVVLGLLYLIFKKDEEEVVLDKKPNKKDDSISNRNKERMNSSNNKNNGKNNNQNKKKQKK